MYTSSIGQYSGTSRGNFDSGNIHRLAANNTSAATTKINDFNSSRAIENAAMYAATTAVTDSQANEINSLRTQQSLPLAPSKNKRSRLNPFEDVPDIERDYENELPFQKNFATDYNRSPFYAANEKSAQLSEGPALINLQKLKKTRQLTQTTGQKNPLVFGAAYAPAQHVCEMMRCLSLMIEPIGIFNSCYSR